MSDTLPGAYQLKISLSRISPMVWRRVLVRADLALYGLHRVIQIAFGWEDFHLHQFKIHGHLFTTQWTGDRHWKAPGQELRLVDLGLRVRQKFAYDYDFGDFLEHEVRVEARTALAARIQYPSCLAGKRAGPPEDCGGPEAYPDLIDQFHSWQLKRVNSLVRVVNSALDEADDEGDEPSFIDEELDATFRNFEPERFDRRTINKFLRELATDLSGKR